ncbi:[Fe-Fe] hydrogenase large subunit C-terminal domain-containing protein, partial [Salmonella enterica]|uniref:[Fe-Fe] hydrogenase large subunit C-terminal domain-containing protein n=1 Tax=Salmonella enterica TaxID=28901 RepID=UPI003CF6A123
MRGFEGIREASLQIGDLTVKVAIVHGLANAKKMLELVREGKADYQFIEVMSCPGGCIGGGGNAPTTWRKLAARRDA